MLCCLNPDCPNPLNPDSNKFCQACSTPLIALLLNRFRVDSTIKLWDVATGKQTRTLKGHSSLVKSVAFSPDDKTILSDSRDGIKIWRVSP
jgi:WD40 repeat protein